MSQKTEALKFTTFASLENWSVQYLKGAFFSYNKNYDLVKIREFLIRNADQINIEGQKTYKRITVKLNNGGVFVRDEAKGADIGTKRQFLLSGGEFVMSKIDARNGAFGIVPKSLEGAIVTNDFPTFRIDPAKINPSFFVLILGTKEFTKFAQQCSSGTTGRQRIDMDMFLNVGIPLPDITEQVRIVQEYAEKMALSEGAEKKSLELEQSIDDFLAGELGIEIGEQKKRQGRLSFFNFDKLERWDVGFLIRSMPLVQSKFNVHSFSEFVLNIYKDKGSKSIRVNPSDFPKSDFRYIGMENVEKNTGVLTSMQCVKGSNIKSQAIRVPKGYTIYGKLRPYLNKYWINTTEHEDIICSSEFFVFDIDDSIDKEYFKSCLSSGFVQFQIADRTSGARMPRINEETFMNLRLPVPPIEIQKEVAHKISNIKSEIQRLRAYSGELKTKAKTDFEAAIFS